jgi:hypothetical protein
MFYRVFHATGGLDFLQVKAAHLEDAVDADVGEGVVAILE